jgi:hypothetical protein
MARVGPAKVPGPVLTHCQTQETAASAILYFIESFPNTRIILAQYWIVKKILLFQDP